MAFWDNVEKLRKPAGLTYRAIAELLGINEATISTMRSRHVSPRAEDAAKIAAALGVSVEYLVTGKDADKPAIDKTKEQASRLAQQIIDLLKQ